MYTNIATYKFVDLNDNDLAHLRDNIKKAATEANLKGTILLAREGINLFLAGESANISAFCEYLLSISFLADLDFKLSYSALLPFKKLVVKIRKEIVSFAQEDVSLSPPAPYLTPKELKCWLSSKRDEFILLDVRNQFEYTLGAFEGSVHLNINNFRDFPSAIESSSLDKRKPVVTCCTGGIRCEKAASYMLKNGFTAVYQLRGGILKYFEECGADAYKGDCFVFDDRVALNAQLDPVNS